MNDAKKNAIRSPYYFVPQVDPKDPMRKGELSVVVCPAWGEQVSHDLPFRKGISGWIDLTITNKTPLFIRDSLNRDSHYKIPGTEQFGIPGTSLRGMLRNVFEIASFSRLQFINSHRYSVRDLNNRHLYTNHMTDTVGAKTYRPTAQTGWLTCDDEGEWSITPCDHWRVEMTKKQTRTGRVSLEEAFTCGFGKRVVNVSDRFEELGPAGREPIWFTGDNSPKEHPHSRGSKLVYKAVHKIARKEQPNHKKGWVILTGRPMDRKHMDFIFTEPSGKSSLSVSKEQMGDFRFIHSDGNEQHSDTPRPNDSLEFWLGRYEDPNDSLPGVPVFYLLEGQTRLRSFGLAQMFKLAYNHSPKELNDAYLKQADTHSEQPDFAELVFGHIRKETEESSTVSGLKGRVTIETAVSEDAKEESSFPAILGSPKASYYPSYVRQHTNKDGRVSGNYKTYMDGDAQIAGWKRYQQKPFAKPKKPTPEQANVTVTLTPLRQGATFRTRMFVHNLLPEELGGLLWCLDFGGRKECRHQMGMGRPFGMGAVQLHIDKCKLKEVVSGTALTPDAIQEARDAFVTYMNDWFCGEWESSEQILDLVALATPGGGREEGYLDYMTIEPNEFTSAKKDNLALPGPRAEREDVQEQKRERWERMASCAEKKAAKAKEQREQAAKDAEEKRQREAAAAAAQERARLVALTPAERIEERYGSLGEAELWQLVQQVFPDGKGEPLVGDLDVSVEAEVGAFQSWLLEQSIFGLWSSGESPEGVAGKKNLKAVYALVTGEEEVDYNALIAEIDTDTQKLERVIEQALQESWPKEAKKALATHIDKTLKSNKRWKKKKQSDWKDLKKALTE